MTVPDGPAGGDRLTNLIGATDPDGGETCVGAANEAADLTFIANAPADLAALAARVAALEAECATQRATLADSRVARVLALIRAIEDDAVAAINGAPNRGALTARLLVLADEQPHPTEVETDHDLDRIGLLTLGPYRRLADTVTANPSAARVLARLTAATEATP
jgi:hypothetical protein